MKTELKEYLLEECKKVNRLLDEKCGFGMEPDPREEGVLCGRKVALMDVAWAMGLMDIYTKLSTIK
jgi:hypothetical protein